MTLKASCSSALFSVTATVVFVKSPAVNTLRPISVVVVVLPTVMVPLTTTTSPTLTPEPAKGTVTLNVLVASAWLTPLLMVSGTIKALGALAAANRLADEAAEVAVPSLTTTLTVLAPVCVACNVRVLKAVLTAVAEPCRVSCELEMVVIDTPLVSAASSLAPLAAFKVTVSESEPSGSLTLRPDIATAVPTVPATAVGGTVTVGAVLGTRTNKGLVTADSPSLTVSDKLVSPEVAGTKRKLANAVLTAVCVPVTVYVVPSAAMVPSVVPVAREKLPSLAVTVAVMLSSVLTSVTCTVPKLMGLPAPPEVPSSAVVN